MTVYLLEPVGDIIKSSFLSYVIHEYDSHGSLVVSLSNCAKSFLASGVPHLKFYPLVKHIDCFDFEVDPFISITKSSLTDGGHVTGRKLIFREAQ